MSTGYDIPAQTGPPPGPGQGPGQGPWQGPWHGPWRHRRRAIVVVAGVALAVAAASSAWAATSGGTTVLSTAAIASKTDPGLVDITSTLGDEQAVSEGTGMVLTSSGEVLTNNHVIAGATSIKVRDIGNGRTYTATVVGYTESNDVAVLQLKGASGLRTVSLGNSSTLAKGQRVVALGNAGGKGGTPSVATGKVTAVGSSITAQDQGDGVSEHLTGLIRSNAGIKAGDSGGPLVNTAGQVVGMDTAASTSSAAGPATSSASSSATTAYSIPINTALRIARQIEAGKGSASVHIGTTSFLGVAVATSGQAGVTGAGVPGQFGQSSSTGAVIEGVVQGTPAARAGLRAGDVITSLGGHAISSSSDLSKVLVGYHPGSKVSISWTDQAGQTRTATIVLTTGPAA